MTNEEVAKLFLKKHRKLMSFRRQLIKDNMSINSNAHNWIGRSFLSHMTDEGANFWGRLRREWHTLETHFNLSGPLDPTKI